MTPTRRGLLADRPASSLARRLHKKLPAIPVTRFPAAKPLAPFFTSSKLMFSLLTASKATLSAVFTDVRRV